VVTWVGSVTWDRQGLVHVAATCDEDCTLTLRLEAPASGRAPPVAGPSEMLRAPGGPTMRFTMGPPTRGGNPVTVGLEISGTVRDTLGNFGDVAPPAVPDHPTAGPQQPVHHSHHSGGGPRRGDYTAVNSNIYFDGRWILARGAAASVPSRIGPRQAAEAQEAHPRPQRRVLLYGEGQVQRGRLHFTGHWTSSGRFAGTSTFTRGSCRDSVRYTARWRSRDIPKPSVGRPGLRWVGAAHLDRHGHVHVKAACDERGHMDIAVWAGRTQRPSRYEGAREVARRGGGRGRGVHADAPEDTRRKADNAGLRVRLFGSLPGDSMETNSIETKVG
jgi:hypothetical protein